LCQRPLETSWKMSLEICEPPVFVCLLVCFGVFSVVVFVIIIIWVRLLLSLTCDCWCVCRVRVSFPGHFRICVTVSRELGHQRVLAAPDLHRWITILCWALIFVWLYGAALTVVEATDFRSANLCLSSRQNCFRCIRIVPFSNNNNNIYIAPGQISVKWKPVWIKSFMSRIKNRQRVTDQNCLWQWVPDRRCWRSESMPGKVCPSERLDLQQLFVAVSDAIE